MDEYIKSGVYTREENEFPFNFNTTLSAKQKASFVNTVVSVVVDDNYYDFLTDMLFDFEIVEKFTDIDLSEVIITDNQIDAIEDFLSKTNVVDVVKENIDPVLINELRTSVEKCIEYKTGIHKNVISEAIASIINTIDNKIAEIDINSMMEMAKIISDVPGELTAEKLLDAYSKSDMYKTNQKKASTKRKKHSSKTENLKIVDDKDNSIQTPSLSPGSEE